MARTVQLICLAYSRRGGGSCVAGVDTQTFEWIRPVAPTGDGSLHGPLDRYQDGSVPSVLDVMEARLGDPRPLAHQPENWLLEGQLKRLRTASDQERTRLAEMAHVGPEIIRNTVDKIREDEVRRQPLERSLALVAPKKVLFTNHPQRPKQIRTLFSLGTHPYDLALTDRSWERAAKRHVSLHGGLTIHDALLVISIGGLFRRCYYKLVAGVLHDLPPAAEMSRLRI
jgi:hypothetical protein